MPSKVSRKRAAPSESSPAKRLKTGEPGESASARPPLQELSTNVKALGGKRRSKTASGEGVSERHPRQEPDNVSQDNYVPPLSLTGTQMLEWLMEHARLHFDDRRWNALERFIGEIPNVAETEDTLQDWATERLAQFRAEEPAVSGKPVSDIVRFSGKVTASLALLAHYPTFLKGTDEVLDNHNPCMQRLIHKGMSNDNTFAMEWHWRKEKSMGSQKCPKTEYSTELIELHNRLSIDLVERLQVPLVVLLGECVAKEYQKAMALSTRVTVLVPVADNRKVRLLLDFDQDYSRLMRIAVVCCHPDGVFRADGIEAALRAHTIDCGLNLLMHLAGIDHGPQYFREFQLHRAPTKGKGGKPFTRNFVQDVNKYLDEEVAAGRVKTIAEMDPAFICWAAAKYPLLDLERRQMIGLSIPGAVKDNLYAIHAENMGAGNPTPRLPMDIPRSTFEHWHGQWIEVKQDGEKKDRWVVRFPVRVPTYTRIPGSTRQIPFEIAVYQLRGSVKLLFGEVSIQMLQHQGPGGPEAVVWDRPYDSVRMYKLGKEMLLYAKWQRFRQGLPWVYKPTEISVDDAEGELEDESLCE